MIISTTQFKLKSIFLYPQFFMDTYRVAKQIRRSGGIIKVKINPVTLRTISAWKSKQDMLAFRNSGAHRYAMGKAGIYGSIESIIWESETIPTWGEAIAKLDAK